MGMARLHISCAGFILGLYLSYQGGTAANDAMIITSFAVLGLSCALLLIPKK